MKNVQTEKIIFNYLIENEDLQQFNKKTDVSFFENKDIDNVFRSIVMLYTKEKKRIDNPIVISHFLSENGKEINKDTISSLFSLSENKPDENWIKERVNEWKEDKLGQIQAYEFIDDIKNRKFDKFYRIYQENNLVNNVEELLDEENTDEKNTPTIDKGVYSSLPNQLKEYFSEINFDVDRERDLVFTSSLSTLSILFPKCKMIWNEEIDRPNLYTFITAPPASGKGKMKHSLELLHTYTLAEKNINERKKQKIEYNNRNLDKGQEKEVFKPINTVIAGNSSTSAFLEKLDWNGGKALIFTTEASDISDGKKHDWGNYDGILRNSFHNESVSSNRKGENSILVNDTFVSASISGTFDQVMEMFDGKEENGLFSRFIFYVFSTEKKWYRNKDISESKTESKTERFRQYSTEINDIHNFYKDLDIEILMSEKQVKIFDDSMEKIFLKYHTIYGSKIISSVTRMGVIARKIIMIFTMFRQYSLFNNNLSENIFDQKDVPNKITAEDIDVYNALSLAKTYIQHTSLIFNSFKFNNMTKKETVIISDKKSDLLNKMNIEFTYKEITSEGYKLKLSERTIERYIQKLIKNKIIEKIEKGKYIKK